jgi:hypothetical protein
VPSGVAEVAQAPLDRGAQRALALRDVDRPADVEAVVRPGEHLLGGQRPGPGGGQLDGQG